MNTKRIVLGGLVAGLVMNVFEFGVEPLMSGTVDEWLKSLGVRPPTEAAMSSLAVVAFIVGIIAVWLYAAIQPRLGAGPKTALIAGVLIWALDCAGPNLTMAAFGLLPARMFWLATIFPLIELPLATLAGAWIYRDGSPRHSTVVTRAAAI